MNLIARSVNRSPLLHVVIPFILGILTAEGMKNWTGAETLGACGFACCLLIVLFCINRSSSKYRKTIVAFLYLGFLFLGLTHALCQRRAATVFWPKGEQTWSGVLLRVSKQKKMVRCVVALHAQLVGKYRRPNTNQVEAVLLTDTVSPVRLHVGDGILFSGTVKVPRNAGNPEEFDRAAYLERQGIRGEVFAAATWQKLQPATARRLQMDLPWQLRFQLRCLKWQGQLAARYAQFPLTERERQVLSALTLGDKEQLTTETRQVFSRAGVSHVLALSGLHLGILMLFWLALMRPLATRRFGRVFTIVSGLLLIWGFTFLTGMSISLLRASTMYSLYLIFLFQHRAGGGLNRLTLAALLLLLFRPDSLFDVGFQLSFLSVGAILLFHPFFARIRPHPKWLGVLSDFVYVSVVAQLATAPLVAYYFSQFPVLFLLSNLVAIPCTYLLLAGSFLFFLFGFIAPIQWFLMKFLVVVVTVMDDALCQISQWPGAVLSLYPSVGQVILLYLLLGLFVVYVENRRMRYAVSLLCVVAIFAGVTIYGRQARSLSPQIIFYSLRREPAVHFIESSHRSWLWMRHPENMERTLYGVAHTFWQRHALAAPHLFQEKLTGRALKCRENIVSFGNTRVAVIADGRWQNRSAGAPCPIDYLLLCRGFHGSLYQLAQLFKPRCVVLDGSLYAAQCKRFKQECRRLGWTCFDLAAQGALVVKNP